MGSSTVAHGGKEAAYLVTRGSLSVEENALFFERGEAPIRFVVVVYDTDHDASRGGGQFVCQTAEPFDVEGVWGQGRDDDWVVAPDDAIGTNGVRQARKRVDTLL